MRGQKPAISALLLLVAAPLLAVFPGTDIFLPSVGRAAGIANWYTAIWVHNPGTSAAVAQFYFLRRDHDNGAAAPVTVTIPAGDTVRWGNVFAELLGAEGFGAIRVTSPERLIVNSRIFARASTEEDRDSEGQFFAAVPASFANGLGQKAQLLGVFQTLPAEDSQFRYNFGFVETTGHGCTVQVTPADTTGAPMAAAKSYPMRAFEQRQFQFKDEFPALSTENARLEIEVISGTGQVIAFGSGIANGSNDPSTFEMSFRDELLAEYAPGSGITGVTAGQGLTGGGTTGSITVDVGAGAGITVDADAVRLADLGVTTGKLADSAVTSAKIADTTIVTGDLADAAVTAAKVSTSGGTAGQVLTVTAGGAAWQAPSGSGGDISAVIAGAGLDGGGTSGDVTLSVEVPLSLTAAGSGPVISGSNTSTGGAIKGTSVSTAAVEGISTGSAGVRGESTNMHGVIGVSSGGGSSYGVWGSHNASGTGVRGTSAGTAVSGTNTASINYGLLGTSSEGAKGVATTGNGVRGEATTGNGVSGLATTGRGVHGQAASTHGAVEGWNTGAGAGVWAGNAAGPSSYLANDTHGVYATTTKSAGYGAYAENSARSTKGYIAGTYGVHGESTGYRGDLGYLDGGVSGVHAATNNYGYLGFATAGVRARGFSGSKAGYFEGDVQVTGALSKGSGSFKIDHPLDPEKKYLYHSFVESPDMMNVYNGNVALDEAGEAWVELPEWFEALNRDFRYQLTCIGGFAPVYIAEKVAGNRFKIAGGHAGLEVSWQVTGIRQDRFANAHRVPVEEVKPAEEQGLYLHPDSWGMPEELGVSHSTAPAVERELRPQGQ